MTSLNLRILENNKDEENSLYKVWNNKMTLFQKFRKKKQR